MIVTLHVATGAAAGALVRSRSVALPLGFLLHLAGDITPHQDIPWPNFELWSGVAALAVSAAGSAKHAQSKKLKAKEELAGKAVRCPHCGASVLVPGPRIPASPLTS